MNVYIDPQATRAITQPGSEQPAPAKSKNLKQLRQSTRDFEAMYILEVYKSMRKNVPDGGLIKKSFSEKMYQEMLDMEMAKEAAAGDGMGIGEAMYDQLKDSVR